MYINTDTLQYPMSDGAIRAAHPNTSFPDPFAPPDGYALVAAVDPPAFDPVTQDLRELPPEQVGGVWRQRLEVVSRFTEYTDEQGVLHTVAEQEAAATAAWAAAKARELQADIVRQTQIRLDAFAQSRGYDDIKSACTYAGCSVSRFDVEGSYCRDKRAETWAALYAMLDEVEAGTRPVPAGFADIEPDLPPLSWPN